MDTRRVEPFARGPRETLPDRNATTRPICGPVHFCYERRGGTLTPGFADSSRTALGAPYADTCIADSTGISTGADVCPPMRGGCFTNPRRAAVRGGVVGL